MVAKAHELNPPLSIYTYAHSITWLNKIWLKAVQELGPNSLIFSFSSGASPGVGINVLYVEKDPYTIRVFFM